MIRSLFCAAMLAVTCFATASTVDAGIREDAHHLKTLCEFLDGKHADPGVTTPDPFNEYQLFVRWMDGMSLDNAGTTLKNDGDALFAMAQAMDSDALYQAAFDKYNPALYNKLEAWILWFANDLTTFNASQWWQGIQL